MKRLPPAKLSETATSSEEMPASGELPELVFVYGELRRGGSLAFRMEGAGFVKSGEVAGTLIENSGTPCLVPRRRKGWVTGDLFQVSADHLKTLDESGEAMDATGGSNYRRVRMKVYQPGSVHLLGEAWVWQTIESTARGRVVRSGDWMEVARPRTAPWCTLLAAGCLLGCFVAFSNAPLDPHMRPPPSLLDQVVEHLVLVVPLVGAVAAWWGLRRRERGEIFTVVILAASALLAVLGLIILAASLAQLVR